MNLGMALRISLKNNKVSQSELARKLGVSRGTINKHLHRWENGKIPTLTTLKKMVFWIKWRLQKIFKVHVRFFNLHKLLYHFNINFI